VPFLLLYCLPRVPAYRSESVPAIDRAASVKTSSRRLPLKSLRPGSASAQMSAPLTAWWQFCSRASAMCRWMWYPRRRPCSWCRSSRESAMYPAIDETRGSLAEPKRRLPRAR